MRRLRRLVVFVILLLAQTTSAQLPLLDNLSRDAADDRAYDYLPWASLDGTTFPTPCDPGYFIQGIDTISKAYDCQPALVIDGSPADGDCPIWNAGSGTWQPGPCSSGGGSPLLVLGPDYVTFDDSGTVKLIYYTGS